MTGQPCLHPEYFLLFSSFISFFCSFTTHVVLKVDLFFSNRAVDLNTRVNWSYQSVPLVWLVQVHHTFTYQSWLCNLRVLIVLIMSRLRWWKWTVRRQCWKTLKVNCVGKTVLLNLYNIIETWQSQSSLAFKILASESLVSYMAVVPKGRPFFLLNTKQ